MKCPNCEEELDVDIYQGWSEVVCNNCGDFEPVVFGSADDAFSYIAEEVS